jgi:DNA-binding transcriptional regulator YdaS (Cro superfamily)
MCGVNTSAETPLERAIRLAGGMTSLARKLNERGHQIKGHATIYQWKATRTPSDYCPDIEAITGVRCEELRPDVSWSVLRQSPSKLPRENRKVA